MEPDPGVKAVLQDARYRALPDEVKAFYWGGISPLWETAKISGNGPRLKRRLLMAVLP